MLPSQCATKRLSKVRCGENYQMEQDNMLMTHQDWVLELLPTLDIIGIPILTTFVCSVEGVCGSGGGFDDLEGGEGRRLGHHNWGGFGGGRVVIGLGVGLSPRRDDGV